MKAMTYQGYAARIGYRDEGQLLVGHTAGIADVVGFHSQSVVELCAADGQGRCHPGQAQRARG